MEPHSSDLGSMESGVVRPDRKDDGDDEVRCVDDDSHSNCKDSDLCQDPPCKTDHTQQITKKNQTDSPILRLPVEIRNKIYTVVFSGSVIAVRETRAETKNVLTSRPSVHALLYTCSQIYWEATSIMYDFTIFDLKVSVLYFLLDGNQCELEPGAIRVCRLTKVAARVLANGYVRPEKSLRRFSSLQRLHVRTGFEFSRADCVHVLDGLRKAFAIPHLQLVVEDRLGRVHKGATFG